MDWSSIFAAIEDALFPHKKLDVWERSLYYHLVRLTRLQGTEAGTFSLIELASALGISDVKARDVIRSLHQKGCVSIDERSRRGHLVRVFLPGELDLPVPQPSLVEADIGAVDFFTGRRYVDSLLRREEQRCFYCLREVYKDNCALDHVSPQVAGVDNSYRNVVVACQECNARKQGMEAADFVRELYRRNLLAVSEFENRLKTLEALRTGNLVPMI